MTPGHRQRKKSILTGGALCAAWWPFPPFIWNVNTSLGLNLFILIWTTPLGLNVTSAIPPFIYSVGPGNHFMLSDPDIFFALFFVVGNFRSDFSCHPFLFHLICLFFLKMGRRPLCPDGNKKKKKKKEKKSIPLTIGRVCQLAYQYAKVNNLPGFSDERQTAGRKWLCRFLVCHPDITLKKAHNLSIAPAMGANPTVIGNWFQLLKKIQDTAGIIFGLGMKPECKTYRRR